MGGSSKGKGGADSSDISRILDPLVNQQAQQAQQVFGATSPLLGGISAQFMNMLGIPYGGGSATMGGANAAATAPQFTWGGANGYSYGAPGGAGGVPGTGGAGSLLPQNPGTGIADLSTPATVRAGNVANYANNLDAATTIPGLIATPDVNFNGVNYDNAATQLFDPSRASALASQFTALPDNVSQFGAAKELAEQQFRNASNDALSMIGGAGGAGAINSTMGQLASDRASGLAQVFANLAANEGLARERGFDRGIGIESGNMGAINAMNQFNAGNTLAANQFNSLNQLGADQFNASNDIGASQLLADMQFRSDQANTDRALATLQNRVNTKNQINQNNIDRAIGIATGGANMGMQGLSGAGSLAASSALGQANLAEQQAARNAGKKNSTGQAAGQIIAAGKI